MEISPTRSNALNAEVSLSTIIQHKFNCFHVLRQGSFIIINGKTPLAEFIPKHHPRYARKLCAATTRCLEIGIEKDGKLQLYISFRLTCCVQQIIRNLNDHDSIFPQN